MALPHPNNHYLQSAQGWLELGNHCEATKALDQVEPRHRLHLDVLVARWSIASTAKQWEQCLHVGYSISQLYPDNPYGYIHHAFALHALGRTVEAKAVLEAVVEDFQDEWVISYNLACYSAQLGNIPEAETYLESAFELGGDEVKKAALKDPDLEPVWKT